MARALIIGAGAIGRGFVPWLLDQFEVDFFDADPALVAAISKQRGFHTHMSDGTALSEKWVSPRIVTYRVEHVVNEDYDIVFICVGPRNISKLPPELGQLRCPIFSLENDPGTVEDIKTTLSRSSVYFGVPDVITSSTASPENLKRDACALHTENGVLYLQDAPEVSHSLKDLLPEVEWLSIDRMNMEWDAKLYIHNTPHCIAAYLGKLKGDTYLHEAMGHQSVQRVIYGVIDELLYGLKLTTTYDHNFIEDYARKEIRRFSNTLLFDPVARVAREPIRKLNAAGRLLGALRLLLLNGVRPNFLMVGIAAALAYDDENDRDYPQLSYLNDFGVSAFLKYHLGMKSGSIELEYVCQNYESASAFIRSRLT